MDLDKAIESRHSVRDFKEAKRVNYKEVIDAISSAAKAPLAGNLSTLRFVIVSNKQKIKDLAIASQQDFIAKAGYVIVVCSDKKSLERYYYERADRYAKQQAGAAIQNMLLKLTELGLGTCWIGAYSDESVKRILSIPENIDVEAIFPIGYEADTSRERIPRHDINNLIFFEKYKEKRMTPFSDVSGEKT